MQTTARPDENMQTTRATGPHSQWSMQGMPSITPHYRPNLIFYWFAPILLFYSFFDCMINQSFLSLGKLLLLFLHLNLDFPTVKFPEASLTPYHFVDKRRKREGMGGQRKVIEIVRAENLSSQLERGDPKIYLPKRWKLSALNSFSECKQILLFYERFKICQWDAQFYLAVVLLSTRDSILQILCL